MFLELIRSMNNKAKVAVAVVAVVAAAGVTSILVRHGGDATTTARSRAQLVGSPKITDAAIVDAVRVANLRIDGFSATNVGGIVVLKGNADQVAATQAGEIAKQLGAPRVANLIVTKPTVNDENIRRTAERQLASTRALDGCTLRVTCNKGVLRVEGTAYNELQSDLARNVLRNVGAQEVQVSLKKL
jgi:hypothetical protein